MKKLLCLFVFLSISLSAFAGVENYQVGLKAYKDGFYDLAEASLMDFLASAKDSPEKNYSFYLLYRVYMHQERFQDAKKYFEIADKIKDERFDRELMERDRLRLTARTDCKSALELLKKNSTEKEVNIYVDSNCPVTKDAADVIAKFASSDKARLKAAQNAAEDADAMEVLFKSMDRAKLSIKQLDYFGKYFYNNEKYGSFWKVYEEFRSDEITRLGLQRLWKIKQYSYYVSNYKKVKELFVLDNRYHCLAVESYKKLNKKFECELLEECITGDEAKLAAFKTACFIKNKEYKELDKFVMGLSGEAFERICGYGGLILSNGLISMDKSFKFYLCKNKYEIAEELLKSKRYAYVLSLFSDAKTDRDRYYLVLAYKSVGNAKQAKEIADRISDGQLKAELSGILQ